MAAKTIKTPFTGDPDADQLLSTDGFALLVGMLLDQRVPHGVSAHADGMITQT